MKHSIYIYIFIMALVTYIIRALPLTLIRKDINNKIFRSFLYYVPYVTLSVMTFPAILYATNSMISGFCGFICALILAFKGKSLFQISLGACICVFIIELFI